MKTFITKSLWIFQVVLAVLLLLMLLSAFAQANEIYNLFFKKLAKVIFILGFVLLVGHLVLSEKISSKVYLASIVLISFVLRMLFINEVTVLPVSDFESIYKTAKKFNEGATDVFINSDYFSLWTYNIPFTLYQSLLLRISDSMFFIQLINCIISSVIVGLIYLCSKHLFNESAGRISGIIACIFPPFIVYAGILTGQTPSILFILLAIYFFVKNKKFILVGLMLGLAHIFRPIGIVFLLSIITILIYQIIANQNYSKDELKKYGLKAIGLLFGYHFIVGLTSLLLISGGFTKNSLYKNTAPNYKLLVGLNHDSKGGYADEDATLLFSNYKTNFKELVQERINERLVDKERLHGLFQDKFTAMWSSMDASFYWSDWYEYRMTDLSEYLWILVLLGAMICILKFRKTRLKTELLFIYVVLAAFIASYFLIEIQTRYRYEIYPLFIILASSGLLSIYKKEKIL